MKLSQRPVEVYIDTVEVVIEEPVELTPVLTLFADWHENAWKSYNSCRNRRKAQEEQLKKEEGEADEPKKPKKPEKRGVAENLVDGISVRVDHVHIRVQTLGPVKTDGPNPFRPAALELDVDGLRLFATDYEGNVVNLKKSRLYNSNRTELSTFRVLEVDSISIALHIEDSPKHYIIKNMPLKAKV